MSNSEFLYQYRLDGDAGIRRIRVPQGMEQDAIRRVLEAKHGRTVELLLLEKTASHLDLHFASLSEGQARGGTNTNDAIADSWAEAFKRVEAQNTQGRGAPSADIQTTWDTAFRKVREG